MLINPSERNINLRLVTLKSWVSTSRRRLQRTHDPNRIRYVSLVYILYGSIPDSLPSLTLYTAPWWNDRGIPYRRDYLLYGPPGTGKSSFSLSLAGELELNNYTLQLSEISESKPMKLFPKLPPHCIVLLEDVDAAGMWAQGRL